MNHITTPRKMPRWIGKIICVFIGHRWFVNSGNSWRCCSRCAVEETRTGTQVWND